MLKRIFPLALFVASALLLAACGGTETSTNTTTNTTTNVNKTTTTTTTNTPTSSATTPAANTTSSTTTTTTTASGDKVGIAECDDFIAKYEACINSKVPEAQRAQYKPALDQWRSQWRQLAGNPQTKASLAQACKTAQDQAKTSMKTYGCDF